MHRLVDIDWYDTLLYLCQFLSFLLFFFLQQVEIMPHNPPQHMFKLPHNNINPPNKLIQIMLQYLEHLL